MKQFTIKTRKRTHYLNVTDLAQRACRESGLSDGALLIFIPHTTAAVTINENADPDVTADLELALERAIPWNAGYSHSEGNAAAHARAMLTGSSVVVPVNAGKLQLGTWQGIFFCEYDGPRTRRIWMSALSGIS